MGEKKTKISFRRAYFLPPPLPLLRCASSSRSLLSLARTVFQSKSTYTHSQCIVFKILKKKINHNKNCNLAFKKIQP